jgi:molybdate transport system substrate-binding protein
MMFRSSVLVLMAVMSLVVLAGCGSKHQALDVFCGSASKPAMEEAIQVFTAETGIEVYGNYGGSGTMLSQMMLAKTGDLYIPGSPDYMVKAEREGVIDPESVERIAYLIPVIAVPRGNPKNIQSLADLARPGVEVGIGNPDAVCLGLYAVEILDYNNLLDEVSKNIVVHAESCSKTAALVSLKAVDAVIGWDVFHDWDPDNIDIVYLEAGQLPRIAYIPAAISTYAGDREGAQRFLDFLVSEKGQEIFRKWGYITSEGGALELAPGAEVGGEYALPEKYRASVP